jgi:hypothetical protein
MGTLIRPGLSGQNAAAVTLRFGEAMHGKARFILAATMSAMMVAAVTLIDGAP